jgi:hypothetical protein
MEGLTRLVVESMSRHGFDRPLDYRRLHWSRWFACESPHSLLLVPSKPGLVALAEEVLGSGETAVDGKRGLAVLRFCDAADMAFVLARMFAPTHPMRRRLAAGHCFVRFVVIEDAVQRGTICNALNQWMIASADKTSGATGDFTSSLELAPSLAAPAPSASVVQLDSGFAENIHCPSPLPSGF